MKPSEEVISLPTHTTLSPCTGKVSTTEMHHERMDGACPGDNIALSIKGLDKNNMPESDHVPALRVKHDVVKPGTEFVSLPAHTASSPSTGKGFTAEMHHQRVDQAHPGDNVALSMKGLDKNNMPRSGDVMVHTAFGDTTSTAATAATESAGEARPTGTTGYCTTTKYEFAVSFDESGPWSRAKGTPSAAATTAVKSVGGSASWGYKGQRHDS